jgi:riboflavin transporter FmnP
MNETISVERKTQNNISVRTISMVALLSAISFILAYLEFPVPLSPSFARMDFSDFPALIGSFAFGPVAGLLIEVVKNTLRLTSTSTGGIGELANFLMGGSFVLTAGLIYKFHKTKRMAWISGIVASVVMGIVAALSNYFILLPLFENFMPVDQLIASFEAYIPFIHTKLDVVLYNAFPCTTLKGLVITVVTMLIYKRIRPILKGIK